jgi:ribose 5-phosphate isomerase RpiB
MDDFDEVQQLEIQKENLQKQIEGMENGEMDFTEANEALINAVKEKEDEDGLVSGTGEGWKDVINAVAPERVESGDVVEEGGGCCVMS